MDELTAGVCLPAALLLAGDGTPDPDPGEEGSLYPQILSWARKVSPQELSEPDRIAFISRMSTPGGVTEAVCRSLREGNTLFQAYSIGISRSREIGKEIGELVRSERG
jgi:hypothetical protein